MKLHIAEANAKVSFSAVVYAEVYYMYLRFINIKFIESLNKQI